MGSHVLNRVVSLLLVSLSDWMKWNPHLSSAPIKLASHYEKCIFILLSH